VVVAPHGAALTNLVFSPPGVKVLHLFAPTYVKHCFWAILDAVPGSSYRYLVGEGRPVPPGKGMQGIQDDIRVSPERVLAALDAMVL
jgi:capsular polysaccharide biosynthesis protein